MPEQALPEAWAGAAEGHAAGNQAGDWPPCYVRLRDGVVVAADRGYRVLAASGGASAVMAAWKRYQVHVHSYGRRLITRDGPCQGLLEWPQHVWGVISTRPMGLAAAVALADEQPHHAVVTLWMDAEKVHDNGKAPNVPQGWYPAEAQIAS